VWRGLRERWISLDELRVGGAHQIKPHIAIARDVSVFLAVLAAVGVNDVGGDRRPYRIS